MRKSTSGYIVHTMYVLTRTPTCILHQKNGLIGAGYLVNAVYVLNGLGLLKIYNSLMVHSEPCCSKMVRSEPCFSKMEHSEPCCIKKMG